MEPYYCVYWHGYKIEVHSPAPKIHTVEVDGDPISSKDFFLTRKAALQAAKSRIRKLPLKDAKDP